MKVIASVVIGTGLLFMGGVAQAVDMGDLDVTIRVIESDDRDPGAITNEIALPDMIKEDMDHDKSGPEGKESESEHHDARDESDDRHEESRDETEDRDEVAEAHEEAREEQDDSKDEVKEEAEDSKDSHDEVEDSKDESKDEIPDVDMPEDTVEVPEKPEPTI